MKELIIELRKWAEVPTLIRGNSTEGKFYSLGKNHAKEYVLELISRYETTNNIKPEEE